MLDIPISNTSIDNVDMSLSDLLKITQMERILLVGNDAIKRASLLWSIVGQVVWLKVVSLHYLNKST